MRVVLQRVKRSSVKVDNSIVGQIDKGILLLLGIHKDDTPYMAELLATKCMDLRIFPDKEGKMNLSLKEIGGGVLVVSQFTLFGDCSKGRRPSFIEAAPPEKGRFLYQYFVDLLKKDIAIVQTGIFGATMDVDLVNDGPVTLILER